MELQDAIVQIRLRADKWDDESLVKTFVGIGPIMPLLKGENNQIIFGRRGTGKTHLLRYFNSIQEKQGDCCVFIDLRRIGSSNGVYSDSSLPIEQRALRFFIDIIQVIHDGVITYITSSDERKNLYLTTITPFLTKLNETWTKSAIDGDVHTETCRSDKTYSEGGIGISVDKSFGVTVSNKNIDSTENSTIIKLSGRYNAHINLLEASQILQLIANTLSPHKIWIIFDEFSELHTELQIILSDILRRIVCPLQGISFKLAAIEHRSLFCSQINEKGYVGLELGADVFPINLDEIMVFGNNHVSSLKFFRELLFRRLNVILPTTEQVADSTSLIQRLFTKENSFVELVLAAEGVPRDFFNVLNKAVLIDYNNPISIPIIRKAARNWFTEDKRSSIKAIPEASRLLDWIISDVISKRQARAFLLKSDEHDKLIDRLFDARILHLIKQNVSSRDTPGVRYNVYSIDYGCYVDLINTTRAPKGLFEDELDDGHIEFIDVPRDDYRSIRRAILDLSKFYASIKQ